MTFLKAERLSLLVRCSDTENQEKTHPIRLSSPVLLAQAVAALHQLSTGSTLAAAETAVTAAEDPVVVVEVVPSPASEAAVLVEQAETDT